MLTVLHLFSVSHVVIQKPPRGKDQSFSFLAFPQQCLSFSVQPLLFSCTFTILPPFTPFSLAAIPLLLLDSEVASQHVAELLWCLLAWLNGCHQWVREVSKDSPVIQEVPPPWEKNRLDF